MLMVLPFPCNLFKLISSHICRISRQWVKMLLFYAIWFLSSSPFVVGIITNELALNPGKQSTWGAKEADYNYIISVLTLKVYVLFMHFTGYKPNMSKKDSFNFVIHVLGTSYVMSRILDSSKINF